MTSKIKISQKIWPHGAFENFDLGPFLTILVSIIETVDDLAKKLAWYERPIYCRATDTGNCFVAPLVGSEFGLEPVDPTSSTTAGP